MEDNHSLIILNSILGHSKQLSIEDKKQLVEITENVKGFWPLIPFDSNELPYYLELFDKLKKMDELYKVEAAGLEIEINKINVLDKIWLRILPLALWIEKKRLPSKNPQRILIGICGPPGYYPHFLNRRLIDVIRSRQDCL